jgi:dienelactone hydrolase
MKINYQSLLSFFGILSCVSLFSCGSKEVEYNTTELHVKNESKDIYGLITKPLNNNKKNPLLICSHGFNGNENIYKDLMEKIAPLGFNVYRFEFCGGAVSSKSSGYTTKMSIMTEKDDLNLVINTAKTWDFVDTDNIYLIGESQGGVVTNMVANSRTDIKGTILWYPAFNIPEGAKKYASIDDIPESINVFGMPLGKCYYADIYNYDPYKDMQNINYKILLVHGTKDVVVPLSVSEKALTCYKNAELIKVDDANHCFYDESFSYKEEYMSKAVEATKNYLI